MKASLVDGRFMPTDEQQLEEMADAAMEVYMKQYPDALVSTSTEHALTKRHAVDAFVTTLAKERDEQLEYLRNFGTDSEVTRDDILDCGLACLNDLTETFVDLLSGDGAGGYHVVPREGQDVLVSMSPTMLNQLGPSGIERAVDLTEDNALMDAFYSDLEGDDDE